MAIIISSPWSIIHGSIAGTTYFTMTNGQIVARQRTKPTQPNSTNQQWAKASLISAVALWNGLTPTERADWDAWAAANPPGTGRQQFIAGQALQRYGDLSLPTGWPVLVTDTHVPDFAGHPSFTIIPTTIATPATTYIAVSVKNTSAHTCAFLLETSVGLGPTRNFWKGPWDVRANQGATIATSGTDVTEWVGLVEGQRYFVRCHSVVTSGDAGHRGRVVSTPQIVMCTAVTNP